MSLKLIADAPFSFTDRGDINTNASTEGLQGSDGAEEHFEFTESEDPCMEDLELIADADTAVVVSEALEECRDADGNLTKSALIMASTMLASGAGAPALETITVESLGTDPEAAVEGLGSAIMDKIKAGVHAFSGLLLKPVNMLTSIGDKMDKVVALPADAVAGKGNSVDRKTWGWIVAGITTALAIATALSLRMPESLSILRAAAHTATSKSGITANGGLLSPFASFFSKITQFKWPFGRFTLHVKTIAKTGIQRVRIGLKDIASEKEVFEAAKKAGKPVDGSSYKFMIEQVKLVAKNIKSTAANIGRVIVDFVKDAYKTLVDMPAKRALTFEQSPEMAARMAKNQSGWLRLGWATARAQVLAVYAVFTGFVVKVVTTGTHFMLEAVHNFTADKKKEA